VKKTTFARLPGYSATALAIPVLLAACGGSSSYVEGKSANPLATKDQTSTEKLAIAIVASPEVVQAKADVKAQWLAAANAVGGVPAESLKDLQNAVDESAYASALSLLNTDPNYPKVVSTLSAPHSWFGNNVPGSRTIFDNPDTTYRTIPVDPAASYVIKGRTHTPAPVDVNFSLWDRNNVTLSNLVGSDVVTDANGNFTITVNAAASGGSANHIQLLPQSKQLFIRNTISEWGIQLFDELSVERVAGPALAAPKTTAQLTTQLAQNLRAGTGVFAYYNQLVHAQPVNTLPTLSLGGSNGRLATQAASYSDFKIADDEALVLNVTLGGAKYFIAPVYTRWMITTDYINHTQSLNDKQALANPDGSYTFVIAPSDPKVYNWLDTVGIHEGLLNPRWQGLPATAAATPASATMKLVKLVDLPSALPATTKYVTPAERQAQIAARVRSYAARYSE
jgi:hypothetical protein